MGQIEKENGIIWKIKEYQYNLELELLLAKELGIPRPISRILINRGIESVEAARKFLNPDISQLYNPYLMKDIDKAVKRIKDSLAKNEKVMIFGDYDVDGITATSLLIKVFKLLGKDVDYYIPNRIDEGYGLNKGAIEYAYNKGVTLIITVDCGISSHEEVLYAKKLGIDIIVTDHHEPQGELPEAYAVVNPKQKDCLYPFKELAGIGVAFKLCQGLLTDEIPDNQLLELLDIVTVGTVADVVPLIDENRIIVNYGLQLLSQTKNNGLSALIKVSGLSGTQINTSHIAYMIAPRINAAGRIANPVLGVELLLCTDSEAAMEIALTLDDINKERQIIEEEIFKQAQDIIENQIDLSKERVIVISCEGWHSGVIGIVASKITEKYFRPCILISLKDGIGKGSGRSIPAFNLFEALDRCKNYLLKYGGHEQAVGLTIKQDEIQDFKKTINEIAFETLDKKDIQPWIEIDANIDPEEIEMKLVDSLYKLEPYGIGNPVPVFICNNLDVVNYRRVGKDNSHIKFTFKYNNKFITGIGFNMGYILDEDTRIKKGEKVSIAFCLDFDNWNGNRCINLLIKDIKFPVRMLYESFTEFLNNVDFLKGDKKDFESMNIKFNNIFDNRNIPDKVDYVRDILKKSDRVLIVVNTPLQGWQLMKALGNEDLLNPIGVYIYGVGYIIDARSLILIAPFPDNDRLIKRKFNDIIFYDMFFSDQTFNMYMQTLRGNNIHLIFGQNDYHSNISIIKKIYPDRDVLKRVYRTLEHIYKKINKTNNSCPYLKISNTRFKDILKKSQNLDLHTKGICYSLEILDELGIIKYNQEQNNHIIQFIPDLKTKANLRDSRKFNESNKNLELIELSAKTLIKKQI